MKLPLIFPLAWRDLLSEKALALCLAIGVAASAAPLILLCGLRSGLIEGARQNLLQDPHVREISSAVNGTFQTGLLKKISSDSRVESLIPRSRTLASSVLLVPDGIKSDAVRVSLLPTRENDPLLAPVPAPKRDNDVVLSASAAARLHAHVRDIVEMRIPKLGEHASVASVPLQVSGIAQPAADSRETAFCTSRLAFAVERYRENRENATWDAALLAAQKAPENWAGFRLYAKKMEDVPALEQNLQAQGIETISRSGEIAGLLQLDHSIRSLILLTGILGLAGFAGVLGSGMWALVERKRLTLAAMHFFGVRNVGLFPLIQAQCVVLAGILLAIFSAEGVGILINRVFAGQFPGGHPACLIAWPLCLEAIAASVSGVCLITLLAVWRAASVEVWEGVSAP